MSGLDPARLERLRAHFDRYVEDGRLPGWLAVVHRDGETHLEHSGRRDLESDVPVEEDTLWRIYSMTKPITSVAAMMLWEEGHFELKDPVARWLPEFADMRVFTGGAMAKVVTEPAARPISVWNLLTHTSGLTYGFHHAHPVDEMYRLRGFEYSVPPGVDLAGACDQLAELPLLFQPGTEWNYGVSTDVLGRVVEVASGQPFEEFLAEHVLRPLGMDETRWWVDEPDLDRLATLYMRGPDGTLVPNTALGEEVTRPPLLHAGGGGLVSTVGDYHRFTQMLLRGGELDGVRLLGPRTVAYMTRNHLPGGADMETMGRPIFAESAYRGVGFGLGVSTVVDVVAGKVLTSPGEYAWGGIASTAFYVDPVEEITAMFFTQFLPSSTYPIRPRLRALVAQALVD